MVGEPTRRRARSLFILAVTIVALAVLYIGFKTFARLPALERQPRTLTLRIVDQRLVSGPAVVHAVQGDVITLAVTSNQADTLHVHEYEQHLVIALEPGREMVGTFTADREGRFPVHLISPQGAFVEAAAIEVEPR